MTLNLLLAEVFSITNPPSAQKTFMILPTRQD